MISRYTYCTSTWLSEIMSLHSVLSVLAELALSIQLPKHLHLTVFPVRQCLVGDSGSTYIPAPHHPAVPPVDAVSTFPHILHLTVLQCLVSAVSTSRYNVHSTHPAPHHPTVPGECCQYKQVQRTFPHILHLIILQCPVSAVSTSRYNVHSHTSYTSSSYSAR